MGAVRGSADRPPMGPARAARGATPESETAPGLRSSDSHMSPDRSTPTSADLSAAPPKIPVLGVPISLTTYESTLDWMDAMVAAGRKGYVCVAATHTVVACGEDPELRRSVLAADLCVPDGQPLVWALAALGHPLPDRVYGPDLMAHHCARAARAGTRVFLYGGHDDAYVARLTDRLTQRFPGLQVVGGVAPLYRELTESEAAEVAHVVNRADPDVIWIGLGVPRQEKFMSAMRDRLNAPVLVGVGAAFDFHSGIVRQAPAVLQRHGLEWLFRLTQEPRRLWRRYAHNNPRFVLSFARQWGRQRLRRRFAS